VRGRTYRYFIFFSKNVEVIVAKVWQRFAQNGIIISENPQFLKIF
jgi:hypothetical protein